MAETHVLIAIITDMQNWKPRLFDEKRGFEYPIHVRLKFFRLISIINIVTSQ
jgi:hypothetical protein